MGVLNKRGAVVLALAVLLLSAAVNFWTGQRQSGAASESSLSAVKEDAMSHPIPGELTPPGFPMTPAPPGTPIQ